jgi:hypothetical protein
MEIVYPPVGIAHITGQIPDLIADRMTAASRVRVACAMQPKAAPHFGTGIVILTAFALARLFQDTFATPATVLLDMLDNAPAQTTTIDGIEYTLCLSHAIDASRSAAETNTEPVRRLAAWASQRAGTGFGLRRYSQIQAQPGFRHGLGDILSRPEVFEPLFSPSEHRLRVRPVCPRCGLVDKTARTVQIQQDKGPTLVFRCGHHGSQAARLDDPAAVIDANTPIRTVLRSLCFSRDRDERGTETIGVPDPGLTANAGLAVITEVCGRLGVIGALDAAVGPVKQRDRGFGAGELLAGIAAAQLAGEDFLTGLDRQRGDAAGQLITPVPGLASTTAAGLARRITPAQWTAVERGLAVVTSRMLSLVGGERAAALTDGPVTIDLDTTGVEVYGRKKRGVAYNHQGQRVGRPHVAAWAEAEIVLAADLGDGTDDPRATAPDLLRRALAALPAAARAPGRVAMRAGAGYFAGQLARAAHDAHIGFAIGARRIAPLWRLLAGIAEDDWHDAVDMDGARVAVAEYCPDCGPRTPGC